MVFHVDAYGRARLTRDQHKVQGAAGSTWPTRMAANHCRKHNTTQLACVRIFSVGGSGMVARLDRETVEPVASRIDACGFTRPFYPNPAPAASHSTASSAATP